MHHRPSCCYVPQGERRHFGAPEATPKEHREDRPIAEPFRRGHVRSV
jgi:hypothetical protein